MDSNVIKFPVTEPKINLDSPEVKELTDKIMELTQCNNLIVLQHDDHHKFLQVGDIKLTDIFTMYCHAIYAVIKRVVEMENENDHI